MIITTELATIISVDHRLSYSLIEGHEAMLGLREQVIQSTNG